MNFFRFGLGSGMQKNPQHSNETERRLKSILRGAFSGPPTPLKDIPKRDGESRKLWHNQPRKRRRKGRKAIAPKRA
jgi:hypothetical protein